MHCEGIDSVLSTFSVSQQLATDPSKALRLNEFEVYQLCDVLGIGRCQAEFLPLSDPSLFDDEAAQWANRATSLADSQGRLILKVVGRNILHKTEAGGVKVIDCSGDDPATTFLQQAKLMLNELEGNGISDLVEGLLAAAFVPHQANRPGQEVLLSLKQDPAFGPCIVLGIGGTLTEWYGAGSGGKSTLIFPADGLSRERVAAAVESHPLLSILCIPSRLYPEPPLDPDLLVKGVMALAELGQYCGPLGASDFTLEEIEINPAVVSAGQLVALDGVGLLSCRKWETQSRPLEKINPLLSPRSAVVMGVSAKGANPGKIILKNLLRSEGVDPERLYIVHHREQEISGVPCYQDVNALPEKCDLAVVAVPAQGALEAIRELVEQDKAESIILIPGGFAEAGEADLAASIEAVLQKGHEGPGGGPVMVGGNCLGIVSRNNYNTFFLPPYKLPFNPGQGENLAVVSQSGAYLVTFASNYDGQHQFRQPDGSDDF